MNITVVEQPSVEPVTLEEAKAFLREDLSNNDDLITALIKAAREWVEKFTNRSYIQRTLLLVTDPVPRVWPSAGCGCCWRIDPYRPSWGALYIELPRSPARSINSVGYRNADGTLTEVDEGWWLDTEQMPGRLYMGTVPWPLSEALRVEYRAGLADSGSPSDFGRAETPEVVKLAIKMHVRLAYDEIAADKRPQMEAAIQSLLSSEVVYTL